jgi:PST family polysaccharide transporter
VTVAAAYVIRGYLLSPVELWMVRKLIMVNIKTYFKQFIVPSAGSLAMTVILRLKLLRTDALELQLQLAIYVLTGCIIY